MRPYVGPHFGCGAEQEANNDYRRTATALLGCSNVTNLTKVTRNFAKNREHAQHRCRTEKKTPHAERRWHLSAQTESCETRETATNR
jgi:hypothetical protein